MSSSSGSIPQSQALLEASTPSPEASLAEVMSRDPEGYSAQDRRVIIEAMRAQRARLEKAEAEGKLTPRATKASELSKKAPRDAGDLGL